jgi:hypothetical protein
MDLAISAVAEEIEKSFLFTLSDYRDLSSWPVKVFHSHFVFN